MQIKLVSIVPDAELIYFESLHGCNSPFANDSFTVAAEERVPRGSGEASKVRRCIGSREVLWAVQAMPQALSLWKTCNDLGHILSQDKAHDEAK